MGILTVCVVTKPFRFEGKKRGEHADLGIKFLKKYVDSLVVVPNDKLLESVQELDDAVRGAIDSPLLETKISGARAVLINITGGRDLTMYDVDRVASQIDEEADKNAIIILGASIKEDLQDEISVTVIAAGFEKPNSDLLNSSVVPGEGTLEDSAELRKPQETKAAAADDDVYKGTSRIDIPTFLQR